MNTTQIAVIDFHGDKILTFEQDDKVYIAVRPIAQLLGLDWSGQFRRLKRHPILSEGVVIMATPSGGGDQETVTLDVDLFHGWLFSIDSNRVKDGIREKVLTYQRECYRVLSEHFFGKRTSQQKREEAKAVAEKLDMARQTRLIHGREAARQMWFAIGLPTVPAMFAPPAQAAFDFAASMN